MGQCASSLSHPILGVPPCPAKDGVVGQIFSSKNNGVTKTVPLSQSLGSGRWDTSLK